MKARPDCVPCYLKVAVSTLRIAGVREKDMYRYLYGVFDMIASLDTDAAPGVNSSIVLHEIYRMLGDDDPYKMLKEQWNKYILDRMDRLRRIMDESDDRLLTALKISVAGNIIDMGITPDFDIEFAMEEITGKEFDWNDYDSFRDALKDARSILVLGDNCGEIVFDTILVKELADRGLDVSYAVKQEPMLNDATMEDAGISGMTGLCRVVETGGKYLGIVEDSCSPDFLTLYRKADIVISKGQANYESLEGSARAGGVSFFILRAKCGAVAESLGVKLGGIVLKKNAPAAQ